MQSDKEDSFISQLAFHIRTKITKTSTCSSRARALGRQWRKEGKERDRKGRMGKGKTEMCKQYMDISTMVLSTKII